VRHNLSLSKIRDHMSLLSFVPFKSPSHLRCQAAPTIVDAHRLYLASLKFANHGRLRLPDAAIGSNRPSKVNAKASRKRRDEIDHRGISRWMPRTRILDSQD
jgi:hypothetical protein